MIEKKNISLEKVVLVGLITHKQDALKAKEYLDELAFLAMTAGMGPDSAQMVIR